MTLTDDHTIEPESAVEYELFKHLLVSGAKLSLEDEESGQKIELSDSLRRALGLVSEALSKGDSVSLVSSSQSLTTQQAADFLGVSRPTVVKYTDEGLLPFERRGTHRRIALHDVLEFQSERKQRAAALADMARDADEYRPETDRFVRTR